jgi:hypothetical protein
MDGYDRLIETKSWAAIRAADSALFDAQQAMKKEGFEFEGGFAFDARRTLAQAENNLRFKFKHGLGKDLI